ncbi:hypothetical protein R5W24_005692 [Gemmata sp. JC717]|uniref:hypothetical protein n=1 Tax=Gemmata algarum TaxID=2975278 RepID=UPI0021BAA586|nr:hypothetical protein [Gemmata algarum]MDY3556526.1 hypothetical protein [Gemmata algarum]
MAIRARFGHEETDLNGEVEGRPTRPAQFRVRSLNFGQHWRTPGVREVSYRLAVPVSFVADLMSRELSDYVADCIAHPDTTPLEAALRFRSWPDAEQILADPEVCGLALEWFEHDCLLAWLGDGDLGEVPGYVINTIASAERRGDAVRFAGTARAAGQPVRYQDV